MRPSRASPAPLCWNQNAPNARHERGSAARRPGAALGPEWIVTRVRRGGRVGRVGAIGSRFVARRSPERLGDRAGRSCSGVAQTKVRTHGSTRGRTACASPRRPSARRSNRDRLEERDLRRINRIHVGDDRRCAASTIARRSASDGGKVTPISRASGANCAISAERRGPRSSAPSSSRSFAARHHERPGRGRAVAARPDRRERR